MSCCQGGKEFLGREVRVVTLDNRTVPAIFLGFLKASEHTYDGESCAVLVKGEELLTTLHSSRVLDGEIQNRFKELIAAQE